jgi:hypothetical protein
MEVILAAQVTSHNVAASLSALVAAGKNHCTVFYELLYSVVKEVVNDNNED